MISVNLNYDIHTRVNLQIGRPDKNHFNLNNKHLSTGNNQTARLSINKYFWFPHKIFMFSIFAQVELLLPDVVANLL